MIPRKTAQEITDQIVAALESEFSQSIPLLRGFNRKLAKAVGMAFVTLQEYGGSIVLQFHPKTAAYKDIQVGLVTVKPLKMWGELVGIIRHTGQRAERTVEISVLTTGGTLTSGSLIRNPKNQMVYQTVGDVSLDAATVTALARAIRVGIAGNVDADTVLHFVNAPDDVEKEVTVTSGIGQTGTDAEEIEEYRERVMERYMATPQGGSYADYKLWAEEVDGVKNAYPYSGWVDPLIPDSRAGQVFVYIESSATSDGVPNSFLMSSVWDHIHGDSTGLANRRNVNAFPRILPISRTTFNVRVSGLGLGVENLSAAQSAIESGLSSFMLDRVPGGQVGYTSLYPRRDIVSRNEVGGIAARIAASYNGTISGVTIDIGGVTQDTPYYLQEGEKAALGTVTWG